MRRKVISVLTAAFVMICFAAISSEKADIKPVVEVAFVIDTTGSMSNLIEGAKAKIWYIAEQIVSGKPTPDVKMALVAFRDKGDEYVTRTFDLTDNIDKVYEDLMGFKAEGGGDTPENVNLALYEAVHKLAWSKDNKTLKIIYLVGDSPPHTDYKDVQSYDKTSGEAIEKGIYITTILCGNNKDTAKIWIEIADAAEGDYFAIDQSGGMIAINTPYDKELSELNGKLLDTAVSYGTDRDKRVFKEEKGKAGGYLAPAGASRAVYAAKTGKIVAGRDLVKDAAEDEEILKSIEENKLPQEMQEMTEEERKKYLEEKKAEREKLQEEIDELSQKRNEFIREEISKSEKAGGGFDDKVMDSLKKQAEKKGIKYED